jgi:hypothetical protein
MGDELRATRELEGLREEMTAIADHLEDNEDVLDGCVGVAEVVGVLRSLLQGATAETIIEGYGLEVEEGGI